MLFLFFLHCITCLDTACNTSIIWGTKIEYGYMALQAYKFIYLEISKIIVYFVNHSLGKLTIKWHVLYVVFIDPSESI